MIITTGHKTGKGLNGSFFVFADTVNDSTIKHHSHIRLTMHTSTAQGQDNTGYAITVDGVKLHFTARATRINDTVSLVIDHLDYADRIGKFPLRPSKSIWAKAHKYLKAEAELIFKVPLNLNNLLLEEAQRDWSETLDIFEKYKDRLAETEEQLKTKMDRILELVDTIRALS